MVKWKQEHRLVTCDPPRKARAVVDRFAATRDEALTYHTYSQPRPNDAKVVQPAAANAENNLELSRSKPYIDRICDEGPPINGSPPGTAESIRKRSSHITVIAGTERRVSRGPSKSDGFRIGVIRD